MNTITLLDALARDLRYTLRGLRHNPTFTFIAVLTLALGIGANTAIFGVVNGVLIKPLSYPQPEALVGVWHSAVIQGAAIDSMGLTAPMYTTYHEQNRTFQQFGVWNTGTATVTGRGDPEQIRTAAITQGILPALGVQPALGRWFSQADDTPATPETIILTYGYWQNRFGGDKTILGRTITVDSRPREVIGVMPADFRFLTFDSDMFLPLRFDSGQLSRNDAFQYQGIARLRAGATMEQANADVARMLRIWMDTSAVSKMVESARFAPAVRPLKQDVVGDVGRVLWLLMGSIGMVLGIACANVANLLLVRADGRQQELAVRAALGAGWGRIARELFVESITLGVLGGALGLALAFGGLRLLVAMGPANLPRLAEISIDPLVLSFALAVSLFSGLLFGFIPVLKYAGRGIASTLGGGGRTLSQCRERLRARSILIVGQVALALVLLMSSGLMIRTFQALRKVQPGFTRPEQIQTFRISIPEAQVPEEEGVIGMQNDILDKIAAIPGVISVAFATGLPMERDFANRTAIFAEGKTAEGQIPPIRRAKFTSPGLFRTQGTPLITGRDFTWSDIYGNREVAIVSENMARETWGEPSTALGKRIRIGSDGGWREVIGVAGNVHDDGLDQKEAAVVYWRAGGQDAGAGLPRYIRRQVTFMIRTDLAGTESFLKQLREAVWAVNSDLPLASVRTLQDVYDRSLARTSFTLVMLAIAGAMALVLGIIGIYGVLSYAVSQRKREIGIRLALGAQQSELKRMFVRHGLVLAGIGIAIGLGAAMGLTRLLSSLLFGISPLDPLTYVAVPVVLATAAVLASYLPARRAAAVDPVEALKAE